MEKEAPLWWPVLPGVWCPPAPAFLQSLASSIWLSVLSKPLNGPRGFFFKMDFARSQGLQTFPQSVVCCLSLRFIYFLKKEMSFYAVKSTSIFVEFL